MASNSFFLSCENEMVSCFHSSNDEFPHKFSTFVLIEIEFLEFIFIVSFSYQLREHTWKRWKSFVSFIWKFDLFFFFLSSLQHILCLARSFYSFIWSNLSHPFCMYVRPIARHFTRLSFAIHRVFFVCVCYFYHAYSDDVSWRYEATIIHIFLRWAMNVYLTVYVCVCMCCLCECYRCLFWHVKHRYCKSISHSIFGAVFYVFNE